MWYDQQELKEKEPRKGELPLSGGMYPHGAKVFGTIVAYDDDSRTYTVITTGSKVDPEVRGGKRLPGVPRKQTDPGDNLVLGQNTPVIIDFGLGFAIIDGVLPATAVRAVVERGPDIAPKISGKAEVNTAVDSGGGDAYYRSPGDARGLIADDWVRASDDGNFLGILKGKVNKFYASEQAQIIAFGLSNAVRIVCENYENFSGFGVTRIENVQGRVNLSVRGAADQLNESGGALENWTFHLDVGATGNLFDMRITSADGKKLQAQVKIHPDGKMRLYSRKSLTLENAGNRKNVVGGDLVYQVTGSSRLSVGGSESKKVSGSVSQQISETLTQNIGNDHLHTINRNHVVNVGGQRNEIITGGPALSATPANNAYDVKVLNGSYVINIGDKLSGANPAAFASYRVFVNNGHVLLGENPDFPAVSQGGTCSVNFNTLGTQSIGLGCIVPAAGRYSANNPPTDSAMMYSKWLALFNKLLTMLDAHTHITAWGPSGPSEYPIGTLGAFNTQLGPMTTPVKSIRVMIGA